MGEKSQTIINPESTLTTLSEIINSDVNQFKAFAAGVEDGQRMGDLVSDTLGNLSIMNIQNSRSDFARDPETHDMWIVGATIGSVILRKDTK